jgi:hypothetical protein
MQLQGTIPMTDSTLHGCLTLQSGEQVDFSLPAEGANALVQSLQSSKPFARPAFVLAGPQSLITCPGAAVVRMDFEAHSLVQAGELEHLPEGHARCEVSAEEWRRATAQMEAENVPRAERVGTPGAPLTVYGRFGLSNGDTFYVRHLLTTPDIFEQRRFLAAPFAQGSFVFRRSCGGVSLLNPSHILYAQYHPGAAPTADSWIVSSLHLL